MKTYLYPQNLKATANLWLWSLKDFTIIGIATLIAVLILVNSGILIPAVAVLIYAFMTIRLEDTTVMDFIRYAVKFFISTQQHFEWADSVRGQFAHKALSQSFKKYPATKTGGEFSA